MNPFNKPSTSKTHHPIYIARKAKELLAKRDNTEITKLVTDLCAGKHKPGDKSSNRLYESFKKNFPNLLIVKLLQVYRFTNWASVRSHTLTLLESILKDLEEESSEKELKIEALSDIKSQLNACLLFQETSGSDFKLLSRIVSRVSVDLFINNFSWDELLAYILSLNDEKMLRMFSDLPSVLDGGFLDPLLAFNLQEKIVTRLRNPGCDEDWCLGLEGGFSLILQGTELGRKDLVSDLVYEIVNSVYEMVKVRKKETVVRRGVLLIARKTGREAGRFREYGYEVVSRLASMFKGIIRNPNSEKEDESETKFVVTKIQEVLDKYYMGGKELDLGFVESFTQSV